MENGVNLNALVAELATAELTAVGAYFLAPWMWIPSVADNALLSVVLTTPFVVLSLVVLKSRNFRLFIRWLRTERYE